MPKLNDKAVYPIPCKPGIKRDGTQLDGNFYSDGQWCRFRNGRPKKMGGFIEVVNGLNGPIRSVYVHSKHPQHIVHSFSGEGLECFLVDNNGVGGATYDRTPAGFSVADVYLWQHDVMFDTGGANTSLVAHPGQNLDDMDQEVDTEVYYGDVTDTAALVTTGESVSGGAVVLQPYLFLYGNNGLIKNSIANNPAVYVGGNSNEVNVAGTKIIRGLALRGGSNAPAGIFWSLDSLIRVTFVGGTPKWSYDTVSGRSSILCSNGPVEYDGIFYWPGIDRFLMYNGVIKEVPNPMNQDFFFDNLNWNYRQKVWGTTVARWGEIWWFFPKGDSVECNHAIIFNVREGSWYDTPVDRSAGYHARVLRFPMWADAESNEATGSTAYRMFKQESGTDIVVGSDQTALPSYIETSDLGFATGGPGGDGQENANVNTRITRVEPDFVQTGGMTVQVRGSQHAQGDEEVSDEYTFDPDTPTVDLRTQQRLLRLRFSSNTAGGDFHMGKVIIHLEPGDIRE